MKVTEIHSLQDVELLNVELLNVELLNVELLNVELLNVELQNAQKITSCINGFNYCLALDFTVISRNIM